MIPANAEWLLVAGSQFLNKPKTDEAATECGRIFSELVKSAGPELDADAAELLSILGKPHASDEEQARMIVLALVVGDALPESAVNAADFAILQVMRPAVGGGVDLRFLAAGEPRPSFTH